MEEMMLTHKEIVEIKMAKMRKMWRCKR